MPRKQKKYHYIYKTTCKVTGKYYYGMHSTNNLNDGYKGSGKRLWYSINKHGIENHICEKQEFFGTREKLRKREAEIIDNGMLKDPMCMNLQLGGNKGWDIFNSDSELQREKSKKAQKKLKQLRENDKKWVDNFRKSVSKSTKGNQNWLGKSHTEKTKQKMSNSHKGKKKGKNNPQFGKHWITNGKENKIIYKENEIPEGYRLGRKIK